LELKKLKPTLVELLVIALAVVVTVYILWPIFEHKEDESSARTRKKVRLLCMYMKEFHIDKSHWPTQKGWKKELEQYIRKLSYPDEPDPDMFKFAGDESIFIDSWGNSIQYQVADSSGTSKRILYSFGKDGKDNQGGKGDIRFIVEMPSSKYKDPNQ
jgi:hypothetical protein